MPKPRCVLLLMGVQTYRAHDFLQAAKRLGLQAHIGLDEAHILDGSSQLHHLEVANPAKAQAQIQALHAKHSFAAILAVDDFANTLAASASKHCALPGNSPESVAVASQKEVFREVMQSAGLPSPRYVHMRLNQHPKLAWQQWQRAHPNTACVLKPTFLNASQGVIRADDQAAFCKAFERIQRLLSQADIRAKNPSAANAILVEDYLHGDEAALEGLVIDGRFHLLAFLDKPRPLHGPFFQESIFITPSRHSASMQALALQQVQLALQALGVQTGPVHAEVRLQYPKHRSQPADVGMPSKQSAARDKAENNTAERAVVLELALRTIGGHCGRSLSFSLGEAGEGAGESPQAGSLGLEDLVLAQALQGKNFTPPKPSTQASGVMMLPIPHQGVFQAIHHQSAALAVPGICGLNITYSKGEYIAPPPEGARYLGFMFARAQGPALVEQALEQAFETLEIEISPAPNPAERASAENV